MDIGKELGENKIVLVIIPSKKYSTASLKIAKKLSQKKLCYVTTNKTSGSLNESFSKKKVKMENVIFVDAISKSLGTSSKDEQSIHVSSPGALTELSLVIRKVLKHNLDYLVFDSLTNLLTYNKAETVSRFISSLASTIKKSGTKGVFYALDVAEHKSMIQKCGMFVDKVITIK